MIYLVSEVDIVLPVKKAIAENIRTLRKEKGLTQKVLGEKSGIAEITIRQYEAGKYIPKYDNALKLASALGVSIHRILDHDNAVGHYDSSGMIYYTQAGAEEYNKIIDRQKSGKGPTPQDVQLVSDYIKEDPVEREWFVLNGLISLQEDLLHIREAYSFLNDEGRKEAIKRIEELTEISRYTDPDTPK